MRLAFFGLILIFNANCKTINTSAIEKNVVISGLPNLNKFTQYKFDLDNTTAFQFKEIVIYFENGITEKIDCIDIINTENQKGFRLTNFNLKIEKGNYKCIIKSNNVNEKKKERIVIKTISYMNKENSYILKIKKSVTLFSK